MTRRVLPALLVTLLVLAARGVTAQQSASDLLAQGIGAYQNLDYDQAATVLRRGLARTTDTLSTADRLRALTYLGATELFRDRRDSALSAFRQIAVSDPKYRPSEIIFPPQVTNVFQDVRQQTKTVFLQVAPVTEFRAKVEHLTARLVASSPHDIAVAITLPDGKPVRDIFAGSIAESLAVSWDGLTDEGEPVKSGRYLLRVTSRGVGAGHLVRQLALEIERARPDTQAWPARPDGTAPPLHAPAGPAVRSLAGGLAAALAVVVLPSIVAQDAGGFKGRFAVAAAIGGAGIASFVAQRSAPPLDVVTGANTAVRDAYRRRLEQVQKQNAQARTEVRLIVRTGSTTIVDQGAQ